MHADGIGLWRTEVGMLARTSAPDENQLTAIFNRAARYSRNKPILIRTIDFTGDKLTDFYENLNLDQYKKEQAKLQKEQGVPIPRGWNAFVLTKDGKRIKKELQAPHPQLP